MLHVYLTIYFKTTSTYMSRVELASLVIQQSLQVQYRETRQRLNMQYIEWFNVFNATNPN